MNELREKLEKLDNMPSIINGPGIKALMDLLKEIVDALEGKIEEGRRQADLNVRPYRVEEIG